ncbi:DUF4396 domain-containing protein [Tomitella cavernea]|uniref:DUF4396 domain-containing protein n=2 Tax=Tomitella cavernea TaxID=1387982 RepID=A0ABP9D3M9_9ACTN
MLSGSDFPSWLVGLAWASLAIAFGCAIAVAVDVYLRPQPMAVMNLVWPICALFGSVLWLGAYLAWGRAPRPAARAGGGHGDIPSGPLGMSKRPRTTSTSVFIGTSHCGAGCTLADLLVEWVLFGAPAVAVIGGMHWLFNVEMYAAWVIAYVAALAIGIGFQYFGIAPMNPRRGRAGNLRAAARADVLSLTAWQLGMYATMALAQLALLPAWLGGAAAVSTPVFWVIMQVAMLFGFATSFPVNWWLIRTGVKDPM